MEELTTNIEQVREYALLLHAGVTEDLFTEEWLSFRIGGKWFLLIQLDAPEPRITVKLEPEKAAALREQFDGITPAYHMNKRHWSNLYLERVKAEVVMDCLSQSFRLVFDKLPKSVKSQL